MALGDRRGFNRIGSNDRTRGNIQIPHNTMQPNLTRADPTSPRTRPVDKTRMDKVLSRFFIKDELSGKKDIELIYLQSSNLNFAAYSHSRGVLRVGFKGGRQYQYFGCPRRIFDALKRSSSKGRFFYYAIRTRYPYQRVR